MRSAILDYLEANVLDGYKITRELPWNESANTPLYLKNYKVVYTDVPQFNQEEQHDTFDGVATVDEIETFFIFVSNDAKTLPTNYEGMVAMIKEVRLVLDDGRIERLSQVTTEYIGSILLTTFAISSLRLMNNT